MFALLYNVLEIMKVKELISLRSFVRELAVINASYVGIKFEVS